MGKRLVKRGGKESARLLIIPILSVNLSKSLISNKTLQLIPILDFYFYYPSNIRSLLFINMIEARSSEILFPPHFSNNNWKIKKRIFTAMNTKPFNFRVSKTEKPFSVINQSICI